MSILYYVKRIRELGVGESFLQAKEITLARTSSIARRAYDKHIRKEWDEKAVLQLTGFGSGQDLLKHFRERTHPQFFFDNQKLGRIEEFRQRFPRQSDLIVNAGQRVLKHQFDLLGSGPTDLDALKAEAFRTIRTDGTIGQSAPPNECLPWHVDFKSHTGWDPHTYYRDIRYGHHHGVDVKVPWELSRFHHLIVLGQAYLLTANREYPEEFERQVRDWIARNPCRFGVNWSCTMEVAIRAVNWIWSIYLFRSAKEISADFFLTLLTSLYSHALHIRENLEFREAWIGGRRRRLNSNHYISNIVGLLYIATMFPELKLQSHAEFAINELKTELMLETADDGVNYEHSISYHRLVLEIFLSGFALAQLNHKPIGLEARERLIKMAAFVAAYSRPDRSAPQIGDNDNGRLHPLSIRDLEDHTYLPTVASVFLGKNELNIFQDDPEAWWWCDVSAGRQPARICSTGYPSTGFYVMRNVDAHVFVSAARVGMCGLGSHSHNDLLSFEYWAQGQAWIVDPGSYIYTPDPDARNLFRSTAFHNGVRIDHEEINSIRANQLFQLGDTADVVVREWKPGPDLDVLDVEHFGYKRRGVLHRRRFEFNKESGKLVIVDSFQGSGQHTIEWRLNLHPSVRPHLEDRFIVLEGKQGKVNVESKDHQLRFDLSESWYSPSYGVKQPTKVLGVTIITSLPSSHTLIITPAETNAHCGPNS